MIRERPARNHFEMDRMLKSLRRLVRVSKFNVLKHATHSISHKSFENLPIGQLCADAMPVYNFQDDNELGEWIKSTMDVMGEKDISRGILDKSLPGSLPGRKHLINLLVNIYKEDGTSHSCTSDLSDALDSAFFRNTCIMGRLATLPDAIFEEFLALNQEERRALNTSLGQADLPTFPERAVVSMGITDRPKLF